MKSRKFYTCILVLTLCFFTSSCTPEKAKALYSAAVQFKLESLDAVNAIDEMMSKEIAAPLREASPADEEFVKNLLSLPDDIEIDSYVINTAIDPYTVDLDEDYLKRRAKFKSDLHQQYSTFASIFSDLEGAFLVAAKEIKRATASAEKLTLQLSCFAKSISDNPPIFLQYRSSILNQFDEVLKDENLEENEKRISLLSLKEKWLSIKDQETQMQRNTLEKCVKASQLGIKVKELIETYNKLSLDDIHFYVAKILDEAGSISGKDLSDLKIKSEEIYTKITSDPILKNSADAILEQITP